MEEKVKRLLKVEEAAEVLGISPRTIYNSIGPKAKKKFPIKVKRIGRSIRFDVADIEKFIKTM